MASRISLARGVPSSDLLPVAELAQAAAAALTNTADEPLTYGEAEGFAGLREWVAARCEVAPAQVLLTNGSLQALELVSRTLLRPGDTVVVEQPTYDFTLSLFRRLDVAIRGVPVGPGGIDLDRLADALERRPVPRLIHTIPTFQNPTGFSLSLEQRRLLVDMAVRAGVYVLEDDPYADLRVEGEALPTLCSLEHDGHVIYLSSFTKTVAPGLRCGMAVLPPELQRPTRELAGRTYIAPGRFAQATILEYCKRGHYDRHLDEVRVLLRERRDGLLAALERHFGSWGVWSKPEGGYFVWCQLSGVDADLLSAEAAELGVDVVGGSDFYLDSDGRGCIRLAFASERPEVMDEAVTRIRQAADRCLALT